MTAKNSLLEIKKAEEKAEKIIEEAQAEVLENRNQAKTAGEAMLCNIANQCTREISRLEKVAKAQIEEKTAQEKKKNAQEIKAVEQVPSSRKDQAVAYVLSYLTKI